MSMLEAECTRCKEVFVPHDVEPEDLIHAERYDGEDCGGIGIIQGAWLVPGEGPDNRIETISFRLRIAVMEQHALKKPDCDRPTCKHHHPELIKLGEHDGGNQHGSFTSRDRD